MLNETTTRGLFDCDYDYKEFISEPSEGRKMVVVCTSLSKEKTLERLQKLHPDFSFIEAPNGEEPCGFGKDHNHYSFVRAKKS